MGSVPWVQLVLHAATVARGGETYELEMGEQIKVVEMVKKKEEIPITYIGIRSGEKLYEELAGLDEVVEPSGIEQIMRVRLLSRSDLPVRPPAWLRAGGTQTGPAQMRDQISELERLAAEGNAEPLIKLLGEIVPTYQPCVANGQQIGK